MHPLRSSPQTLGISAIPRPPGSKKLAILVRIVWACPAEEAQVLAGRKQDLLQSCCLSVRVPKLQCYTQGLQALWSLQALCPSSLGARIPVHKDPCTGGMGCSWWQGGRGRQVHSQNPMVRQVQEGVFNMKPGSQCIGCRGGQCMVYY